MEKLPDTIRAEIAKPPEVLKQTETNCPHEASDLSLEDYSGKQKTGYTEFLGGTITCNNCGLVVNRKPVGETALFYELYKKLNK